MAPRTVRLTSPERVLFPDMGITKQGLFEYYRAIAPALVPHLRNRPFTMIIRDLVGGSGRGILAVSRDGQKVGILGGDSAVTIVVRRRVQARIKVPPHAEVSLYLP